MPPSRTSTGRAQKPFVELAILGAGDAHLPSGERGEIAIKSAANIKCYWEDPEATRAAFTADGYHKTGDVGYVDEDGYLFIVDRKKDIIIRGGENIACAEVEAEIYACPAVAEACVFGMPDDRLGEVPVAVIYPHEDSGLTDEDLRGLPRTAHLGLQDPRAVHLRRPAAAEARNRQDRPRRDQGSVPQLKPADHPP